MKILITGGSGVFGQEIAPLLAAEGHQVRVLTRRGSSVPYGVFGDLVNKTGLPEALSGVDTVIHAASQPRSKKAILAVDRTGTQNLVAAAKQHNISQLLYTSILGVDQIPLFYFQAKHAAEHIIADSSIPWTVVRIAQFHELIDSMLFRLAKFPIIPLPRGSKAQPISAADAARHTAEILAKGPTNNIIPLGGPEILTAPELAKIWTAARKRSRPILSIPTLGKVGRGFAHGYNLAPKAMYDGISFKEWLENRAQQGIGSAY